MAYEKQTWVDGATPIDAEHLNHIEDGVSAASNRTMYISVNDSIENVDAIYDAWERGTIIVGIFSFSNQKLISSSANINRTNNIIRFSFYGFENSAFGFAYYTYNNDTSEWDYLFIPIENA